LSSPLISIVIPVFNKELWVTETLRTVFNQEYKNWECVIINDGSTDESLNRIMGFIENHPARWRVITIDNSGQTFARNFGIKISEGDYIAFLDADDLWHPNKLDAQIQLFISRPELELAFSPYVIFSENQRRFFRVVKGANPMKLVKGWLSMQGFGGLIESTGMVKRSTLMSFGLFSDELSMTAGLDLSLRIAKSRPSLITSQPYVFYRLSESQFHKNEEILISDLVITSAAHTDSIEELNLLKISHTNYLYWSRVRSLGRVKFINRVLLAFLAFDLSKLAMLYCLTSRNVIAIYRGAWGQRQTKAFLQAHRIKP
jgi:glycosyltransferase involved in cell wall biosynthesis